MSAPDRPSWFTADICAECDYDLRGLSVEGKCPECGLDIAKSVPLPVHAWPERVRHVVSAGAWFAAVGNFIEACLIVLAGVVVSMDYNEDPLQVVVALGVLMTWCALFAGWCMMSMARKADLVMATARKGGARGMGLGASGFGLGSVVLVLITVAESNGLTGGTFMLGITALGAAALVFACYLVGHFKSLDLAQTIGQRAGVVGLEHAAKWAGRGTVLSLLVVFVVFITSAVAAAVFSIDWLAPVVGWMFVVAFGFSWLITAGVLMWAGKVARGSAEMGETRFSGSAPPTIPMVKPIETTAEPDPPAPA